MNLIKISTLATALAIFGGISHAHSNYSQSSIDGEARHLHLRSAKKLEVNLENASRTIALNKCEEEGVEEEVRELLEKSPYEESWAYLPEKCEWHEIGNEEEYTNHQSRITIDMPYLLSLMRENKKLVVYHFHPLLENMQQRDSGNAFETKKDDKLISNLRIAMPSLDDLLSMMGTSLEFDQLHLEGELEHKIVTKNGIVAYGLTDFGKISYDQQRRHQSEYVRSAPPISFYLRLNFAILMSDESLSSIISESQNDIQEAARIVASKLSDPYLRINLVNFKNPNL